MNGELVNRVSNICHFQKPVVVTTRYSGQQIISIDSISSNNFNLLDSMRNIHTKYYHSQDSAVIASSDVHNFSNLSNYNRPVLDAHWGAITVWNYWRDTHNRFGSTGQNNKMSVIVHYPLPNNGFYSASDNSLNLGDGSDNKHSTSLDWIGHEYGHGITRFSIVGGLTYQGESGAMNESFSDIWAACIDARNGKNPWLIFDEVQTSRSMSNPNDFDSPDTYQGQRWRDTNSSYDYGGVHFNSGVMNYWFYLLSVGGNGINDIGNVFNVAGITIAKSELIAYRAYNYLIPNSQYSNLSMAVRQATIDIYGTCSPEFVSVNNALYAVGLVTQPYTFSTSFVSYPNRPVCNVGENYNFGVEIRNANDDLIYNNMYRWELANGSRTLINGQATTVTVNSSSVTVSLVPTAGFPDGYWETITATPLDCINYSPVSFRFWVGKPDPIAYVSTPTQTPAVCPWSEVSIPLVNGATHYRWVSLSPSLVISSGVAPKENTAIFRIKGVALTVRFGIIAYNECSQIPRNISDLAANAFTYSYQEYEFDVLDGSLCRVANPTNVIESKPTFVGYPNPAENVYTISTQSGEKQNFAYTITNSLGITVLSGNSEMGEDAKLDVSSLANGLYVVQIQKGKNTEFLKFVVQKGIIAN